MTTRTRHAAYNQILFRLDAIRCSLRDRQFDSDEQVTEEMELAADALERVADQCRALASKLDLEAEREAQAAQ